MEFLRTEFLASLARLIILTVKQYASRDPTPCISLPKPDNGSRTVEPFPPDARHRDPLWESLKSGRSEAVREICANKRGILVTIAAARLGRIDNDRSAAVLV